MKREITQQPADDFTEILSIIEQARENAYRVVNRELIAMYWEIGRYVSEKVKSEGWGKSVVQRFSDYIRSHFAGIKGFSPQNIWRMRQFYETYAENPFLSALSREIAENGKLSAVPREITENGKLSPLVREISWSHNVLIMSAAKTAEEREFYLLLTKKNNYRHYFGARPVARYPLVAGRKYDIEPEIAC
jgi:predicted nuclease of restriction endonuclease-like (RecB) superfamily